MQLFQSAVCSYNLREKGRDEEVPDMGVREAKGEENNGHDESGTPCGTPNPLGVTRACAFAYNMLIIIKFQMFE